MFAPVTVARASSAIADQIRAAILGGQLKEGERLPPERTLADQFRVSRVTVRDALRALEAMGLIAVRVGARGGAFVTAPTGSVVAQTMSDMVMMSAVSPEDSNWTPYAPAKLKRPVRVTSAVFPRCTPVG